MEGMLMLLDDLKQKIKKDEIEYLDLRFTDLLGKEQHVSIPVTSLDDNLLQHGKGIDGSSLSGWQDINHSDLSLKPELTALNPMDPFYRAKTLLLRCDVIDPTTGENYSLCPRVIAKNAEHYLKSTGIADSILFGPEPEFFIFDNVRWSTELNSAFYKVDSEEGIWNSSKSLDDKNFGHRPGIKGGYFPVPPVDSSQDIRSTISSHLAEMGIEVEAHHHEVATANQCEVATKCNTLVNKADELQLIKYVIQNVAHQFGKTATFMPKPLVGDNGSGMHCHQSLSLGGVNIFTGDSYAGLSKTALYYIGGIITHAKSLNALTNPTINSYKRLLPGFEAPVNVAYGFRNRSASIRIPYVSHPRQARIEVRFPDCMANPYLAFSAMMMAGLDGIMREIHPGDAVEDNLFDTHLLSHKDVPKLAVSLEDAMRALEKDYEYLLQGHVFTQAFLDSWFNLLNNDIQRAKPHVHPIEFEMYYSR